MILYPAIDILEGQVVRLIEGDFEQKTIFAQDPYELLNSFEAAGVQYVHLVDLSGAKNPRDRQVDFFLSLLRKTSLKIQIGGGLRQLEDILQFVDMGVDRVVIGSLAVKNPSLVLEAIERVGAERITLALDIRKIGDKVIVMTEGWTESSGKTFQDVLMPFMERGIRRILCTDIAVDGRSVGPNLELYQSLKKQFPQIELQASGGVSELSDLKRLHAIDVHSVVVGRALLSGRFTLQEALSYAK